MEELIPLMVVSETEAEIALMNMEPSGTDYAPLPDHNAATDTPIGNTGSEDSTVIALETTSASRNYGSSSRNYCSVMNPIYESNPYLVMAPSFPPSSFSFKDSMLSVKNVFGKWGKKVAEKTKKAEDLAVNTWQHLKTGPSFTEVALERVAQTTKLIAEGGHEKIFRQTFETTPEELLQNSFACYFASSGGPVIGTLYASTKKLAYCSDNPLPYESSEHIEWIYYKVVIPLHLLKEVNPSVGVFNRSEKYIHLISMDGHEFWFTGFINYEGAVNCLKEALESSNSSVQFL